MSISDWDTAVPGTNGNAGLGDDYLREVRADVKEAFPAVDGIIENSTGTGGAGDTDPPDAATWTALFARVKALEDSLSDGAGIAQGMIVYWNDVLGTVPTGWTACTTANAGLVNGVSVPDLSDQIIVSVGSSHAPGFTYGGTTTGAGGGYGAGVTDGHSLTVAELPDISSAIQIDVDTFNSGGDHLDSAVVAGSGGDINATTSVPFTISGMNGAAHTHNLSGLSDHTHTQAEPVSFCLIPICYTGTP